MSTFDYRVIKKENPETNISYYYYIGEVFYDENGKAILCSDEEKLISENVEELIELWAIVCEAFSKPIVNYSDIPEEDCINEFEEALKEIDDIDNLKPFNDSFTEWKNITKEEILESIRKEQEEKEEIFKQTYLTKSTPENALDIISNYYLKINEDENN